MGFCLARDLEIGPEEVGIAIGHGTFGGHLGVIFTDDDDQAKFLHLAWHQWLVVEDYPPCPTLYIATKIPFRPLSASIAAALLIGMAGKYKSERPMVGGSVDYGINLYAGANAILEDGTYKPGPGCDGFTCASIIAAVFQGIGLPLVDLNTWQPRRINIAWGKALVCVMRATAVDNNHITKVEKNSLGVRLCPEEVAAAAELEIEYRPASQALVAERAKDIMNQVHIDCGAPPDTTGRTYHHCVAAFKAALSSASKRFRLIDRHAGPTYQSYRWKSIQKKIHSKSRALKRNCISCQGLATQQPILPGDGENSGSETSLG